METIPATAGFFELFVTTNTTAWKTSGVPEWLTLSPESSKTSGLVKVTYTVNKTGKERKANINFSAGEVSRILSITQATIDTIISIDKTSENVSAKTGNLQLQLSITDNISWNTINIPEWATLSPDHGTNNQSITLNYEANTSVEKREATITFFSGSKKCTFSITQEAAAATISIDKTSENVTAAAGATTIKVTTNGAAWNTSGVPEWITLSPESGTGSQSITLNYKANNSITSRKATITFSAGDNSCTLDITQAQRDMQTDYSIKATGGTIEVSLRSNIAYSIAIDVDWITEIPTREATEQTQRFSVKVNDSKQKRTGHITFSGSSISHTVTVIQSESGDLSIDINDWDDDGINHGGTAE